METYATALSYAIPGFVGLIIFESIISKWMGRQVNRGLDTISSISSGITNTLKSLMGLSIIILSYEWMVDHLAIFNIQQNWLLYVLTFIGLDFAGYWSHRWNHEFNVLWNRHIIHHSSEEFNLACALRQEVSAFVSIYFFLYIPIAILGVPGQVVAVIAPIHFFAQFWYHTRLIKKMGLLEYVIVTPSHHRVHHAINNEYIDKNYGQIFIIWDKLFGTFQAEIDSIPAIYGVKKAVKSWNPFLINFMHLWQLIKDAWRTKNWIDKIRIWFMPTGWRPKDVAKNFPVPITTDVYKRTKYDTSGSKSFIIWSWTQLIITVLLMYHLLISFADFRFVDMIGYASFLMVSIFAYTALMDRMKLSILFEIIKSILGVILLIKIGNWYNLSSIIPSADIWIIIYLISSLTANIYFIFFENTQRTISGSLQRRSSS